MQVGSLVERINKGTMTLGNGSSTVVISPSTVQGHLPFHTPVVISGWKFSEPGFPDMFSFMIEGYEYMIDGNGVKHDAWYGDSLLRELQPPMDMSFINEIQLTKPEINKLCN